MSLFAELKRRNVIKVSAAYLALAWIVTQVTGTVVPAFELPAWTLKLVIWLGVIGFPFVVVFAWVFELTPEGLKRESEIDRSQSITHVTSKKLDYIIIALLVAAIGVTVLDRLVPRPDDAKDSRAEARPAAEATADDPESPVGRASARHQPTPATAPTPDDKSIAVLPFTDMSQAKDQEYFSDGISEELLNLLARVPELHVAARTSSFAFKGKELEIPEIARRLNVAHVLEGSVRKSGDKVRITAQLIRAADGYHLWSQSWDRTLDDIFAVQDEIAAAVVVQMKVTLLGAAPTVQESDPRAYALYLQGRQLALNATVEGWERALGLYQQALAIDPDYVAPLVGLAGIYINQSSQGLRPAQEGIALAREAVQKALGIDPQFAPAHAALGRIAMNADFDLAAAATHYAHALAIDPSSTDLIGSSATLALYLGRAEQGVAMLKYQVAHDPVNASAHYNLSNAYCTLGHYDACIDSARTSLALSPANLAAEYCLGVGLLLKGDAAGALEAMQREQAEIWRMIGIPLAYHALGRRAESDAALAEAIAKYEKEMSWNIAYVYAYRGEADRAFEWLHKAEQYHDAGMTALASEPLFANIHRDPRWLPLLQKRGMTPEQLAAIPFEVTLPK